MLANIVDVETKNSVSTPNEIARVFNHHFTNISCTPVVPDASSTRYINDFFLKLKRSGSLVIPSEGFSFKHFNSNEVEKARQ